MSKPCEYLHKCPLCFKQFKSPLANLKVHMKNHCNLVPSVIKCMPEVCDCATIFETKTDLLAHIDEVSESRRTIVACIELSTESIRSLFRRHESW